MEQREPSAPPPEPTAPPPTEPRTPEVRPGADDPLTPRTAGDEPVSTVPEPRLWVDFF